MSSAAITQPFPIFNDLDGQPLDGGYIWIGVENLPPQTNPQTVYWDEALTQPAAQPIRTQGGYPVNSGTPARLYIGSAYSILVQERRGMLVYSALSDTVFTDSAYVTFLQAGTGAVARTGQSKMREVISVKDFGAVGNGVVDDTAAIVLAVAACQAASQTSLFFPTGIYRVQTTIALGSGGTPGIAFVGETATAQQGSSRPAVTIRWHGGASAMFDVQNTYFSFYNIAFENFTTATDVCLLTAAMHMTLDNCSFVVGSGATRFSRSVLYSDGNEFGYSVVKNCTIQNPAPRFLDIDGKGTGNGITPVLFQNNVIESNSLGAHTVVYIKDEGLDILTFSHNTFNGQANAQLTIVDTTDSPISETIAVLNFYDNEIDLVANTGADRCFRLTNVSNVNVWGNQVQGGGSITAVGNLVNTTVTLFQGNQASSIAGPFWSCDATSRVFPGVNKFVTGNTAGIASDPGTGKAGGVLQVVTATYSTQTTLTTSYADLVSATITPLSETSKILVIANVNGLAVTGNTTSIQVRINRDSTPLLSVENEAGFAGGVTSQLSIGGVGATYMDAPGTASAVTYKVQVQKTGGSGAFVNTSSSASTITVMEVAA